jgi:hypothetical protein
MSGGTKRARVPTVVARFVPDPTRKRARARQPDVRSQRRPRTRSLSSSNRAAGSSRTSPSTPPETAASGPKVKVRCSLSSSLSSSSNPAAGSIRTSLFKTPPSPAVRRSQTRKRRIRAGIASADVLGWELYAFVPDCMKLHRLTPPRVGAEENRFPIASLSLCVLLAAFAR